MGALAIVVSPGDVLCTTADRQAVVAIHDVVVLEQEIGSAGRKAVCVERERSVVRSGQDSVIVNMEIVRSFRLEVPSDRLVDLHVHDHARVDVSKEPTIGPIGLLHQVPPLLTVAVDPTPVRIGGSAQRHIASALERYPGVPLEDSDSFGYASTLAHQAPE